MKEENWEKEFDGKFIDWNNPSQFASYYEGTKKVTPSEIKKFIHCLLQEVHQEERKKFES